MFKGSRDGEERKKEKKKKKKKKKREENPCLKEAEKNCILNVTFSINITSNWGNRTEKCPPNHRFNEVIV